MKRSHDPDVEEGIPIPQWRENKTAKLRKLAVPGQSVLLKGQKTTHSAYKLIANAGLQGKCTCRLLKEGVRVWRVR